MPALELERLGGELQARPQVIALEIGKLLQQILEGIPCGKVFEQGFDRITQVP
jgi:hypothetical protein